MDVAEIERQLAVMAAIKRNTVAQIEAALHDEFDLSYSAVLCMAETQFEGQKLPAKKYLLVRALFEAQEAKALRGAPCAAENTTAGAELASADANATHIILPQTPTTIG